MLNDNLCHKLIDICIQDLAIISMYVSLSSHIDRVYELTLRTSKTMLRCIKAHEEKQISWNIIYYVYVYQITRPSKDPRVRYKNTLFR